MNVGHAVETAGYFRGEPSHPDFFLLLKKLLQPQTTEQQLVESEMRNGSLSEGAKDVSRMRCDSGFGNESRSACLVR